MVEKSGIPNVLMSMISILVDDRERSSAVMEGLRRYDQVEVQVQRLAVGDYCLDKHLMVERKTLPDMMASIVEAGCSGRP